VPGGPVEQVLAQLEGEGDVFAGISGGGVGGRGLGDRRQLPGRAGLPPQFLDELRVQFNFARIVCEDGLRG
jgi:microcin C transport system permease protein